MKRFFMVSLLLLTACTTSPVSINSASPVPSDRLLAFQPEPSGAFAPVVVVRDSGFQGSACDIGFYVDGKLSASFAPSERATFNVPVGEHIFGASQVGGGLCGGSTQSGMREVSVVLHPGGAKKMRIGVTTGGDVILAPTAF
jgi:hypothetical protein